MTLAKVPLSVCIITKNEQQKLPACLESVKWATEIIVVDDFSTDSTREICESYDNLRFVTQEFTGFGQQKRFAVSLATNDWVLSIDADETVTSELRNEVSDVVGGDREYSGYFIRRDNLWFGKYYVDSYPGSLRLFRKSRGSFQDDHVHEKVKLTGPTGQLDGLLRHHPASFENFKAHYDTYAIKFGDLAARDYLARGERVTLFNAPWKIVLIPLAVFIRKYFLHRNLMRGRAGLYVSVASAMCYSRAYRRVLRDQTTSSPSEKID